jgi:isoleucyl-tRNA synthetase
MTSSTAGIAHYPTVNPSPSFPELEENILAVWEAQRTFEASVEGRAGAPEFVFYDGPPFANGLPHYGHLLTGYVKDAFARYQTMRGNRVERRFGWDCHGLPAEMGSEKELGISGRAAIQNFGIDKFNAHCRESVMKYTSEWEAYVTRQARWVDFKNDYKTMDKNFMESVLWAFKQLYDKGLVYEAHRVMPYSWAAETPLSNFETKLDNSYREREDKAITVAFELNEVPENIKLSYPSVKSCKVYAWTTTPWTLPSNLALAISKKVNYCACIFDDVAIITSSTYAEKNFPAYTSPVMSEGGSLEELMTLVKQRGEQFPKLDFAINDWLIGLSYKPLFPYFEPQKNSFPNCFTIIDGSSFVTDGDGTGIVHIAPGFGEDDKRVADENNIPTIVPVDGQGKYTAEIFDLPNKEYPDLPPLSLKGLNVICENVAEFKFGEANERIIRWLKDKKHLVGNPQQYKHNYPHCWRTDQPLIYRAMPSWYVEVTKFRDRAVELNKQINWIPEHVRDGQMGHMLATAPDWSISRNRFWGTPIPVWRSKSGKIIVCGSIAEIEELSGQKVADLHRPFIDDITFEKDGETYTRVADVFDCWFESGSMPFAQVHYPFENKEWFETHFPADFITEYVGQTRGWFNTLIMLSTALFDCIPFKNCICHGVMLGESVKDENTGKMVAQKLSKRLKNYPEPTKVFNEYGSDALRWFLISSSVMRGNDLQIDKEGKFIRDVVRLAIKPIWNAYNFFCLYANADGVKATLDSSSQDIMDRYILAKCRSAIEQIKSALDAYDTPTACDAVTGFFETLNNWYIRRSKERFWDSEQGTSKQEAYNTLYTVLTLMCRAAAPLLPLTLDEMYRSLTGEASVHLSTFPDVSGIAEDGQLAKDMDRVQDICNTALGIRNNTKIRVRQPLLGIKIVTDSNIAHEWRAKYGKVIADIIKSEINVKEISEGDMYVEDYAVSKLSINSAALGKRLPAIMKQVIPASKKGEWKQVNGTVEICGEKLLPSEFTLQLEPKPEYANRAQALSTNDALVILDTTITPDLEAEGIARDAVRAIQQARKDAALNVSDRIVLHIDAPEAIRAALHTHSSYIAEQTLAREISSNSIEGASFTARTEIAEQHVTISLKVA